MKICQETLLLYDVHGDCVCLYQVSGLSQRVAELEGQLDRAHRDESSLTNQLEDTLQKLTSQEQDNTKVNCVHCAWNLIHM